LALRENDLSGVNEYRVYGPPGTGKTTFLSRQINKAVKKYGSDRILVSSFTKAAAEELIGRNIPISERNIGTLHAHCYRSLGRPELVVEHLDDWNDEHPDLRLSERAYSGLRDDEISKGEGVTKGDEQLRKLQIYRGKMVDKSLWESFTQYFYERWEEWKSDNLLYDFTDLIEVALEDELPAPYGTEIGFYDEVQDFTKLELSLVRQWAEDMERIMIVGDDDQNLYSFKGATPEAFLNPPVPEEQVKVLDKSYRVPEAVRELSQKWIKQIPEDKRKQKEYKACDREGEVRFLQGVNYNATRKLVDDCEEYLKEDKEVMFLTSCSYMLEGIIGELRERGIPYHNPYARKRGDWNPFYSNGITGCEKIMMYFKPVNEYWGDKARLWNWRDLYHWTKLLKSKGNLRRGAKKRIKEEYQRVKEDSIPDEALSIGDLLELFTEKGLDGALDCDIEWLEENMLGSKKKKRSIQFPIKVLKERGFDALRESPQVKIGTIHSVKGGEADVVYLFPDLSPAGNREWRSGNMEEKASVIRQFYVGMTRCKEVLCFCNAVSENAISIRRSWLK